MAEALSVDLAEFAPGAHGTPYRYEYYGTRIFSVAVATAGLPASTTTHDLRQGRPPAVMAVY
jgi:hypothetical protein